MDRALDDVVRERSVFTPFLLSELPQLTVMHSMISAVVVVVMAEGPAVTLEAASER